jgi:hypothetical protein
MKKRFICANKDMTQFFILSKEGNWTLSPDKSRAWVFPIFYNETPSPIKYQNQTLYFFEVDHSYKNNPGFY